MNMVVLVKFRWEDKFVTIIGNSIEEATRYFEDVILDYGVETYDKSYIEIGTPSILSSEHLKCI